MTEEDYDYYFRGFEGFEDRALRHSILARERKRRRLAENVKDEGSRPLLLVAMDPVPRQLQLQQLQLKGMSWNQFGAGTI
jgi:hypothetical protein